MQHETHAAAAARPPGPTSNGVAARAPARSGARAKLSHFYFNDRVDPLTPAELAAAHHEHGHEEHAAVAGELESAGERESTSTH